MRQIKLLFTALTAIFLMSGVLLAQDTTMTITNYGSVGIGTQTPDSKLQVNGTFGAGDIFRFGNHMNSTRVAADNEQIDVAVFGSNEGTTGFEAGVYGRSLSPAGYGVFSEGNFGVSGNASINGSLDMQAGFRATGPNGSFWFTPEFGPGSTILLGVYTGFGAFPVVRFVETNDTQAYVDIGQNGDGNFTVASPAGQLITADRLTGDTEVKGNLSANSINTGSEALKIVRGSIDVDGTIQSGSGFTVTKDNTGEFTITFTEPFTDYPTVSGSTVNPGVVTVSLLAPGEFVQIRTRKIFDDSLFDTFFSFTAIGGTGPAPAAQALPVISADK